MDWKEIKNFFSNLASNLLSKLPYPPNKFNISSVSYYYKTKLNFYSHDDYFNTGFSVTSQISWNRSKKQPVHVFYMLGTLPGQSCSKDRCKEYNCDCLPQHQSNHQLWHRNVEWYRHYESDILTKLSSQFLFIFGNCGRILWLFYLKRSKLVC